MRHLDPIGLFALLEYGNVDGRRIGTRFVAAAELGAHPGYVVGGEGRSFASRPPQLPAADHAHRGHDRGDGAGTLGESVGVVRDVRPAADIVRELMDDAEQLLRRWR
jgi:hypothetical protein